VRGGANEKLEYVNQKMLEALDEYEASIALVDTDPGACASVMRALMKLCDYSELYEVGEMPLYIMIRYHGVFVDVIKRDLEII